MWLEKHPEVDNYLIFDDDKNILDEQSDNFIQTEIRFGLQERHFQKARIILLAERNL